MKRVSVLVMFCVLASACVPLPQRVQDEFSPPDGERPNNFEIRSSSDRAQSAAEDS